MPRISPIGVDNKQYVFANLSNRLYPDFSVVLSGVRILQSWAEKDTRGIIEAEAALSQCL
jgi:hypothetical protein